MSIHFWERGYGLRKKWMRDWRYSQEGILVNIESVSCIFHSPFKPQVKGEGKWLSLSWYKEQTRVMTSLIFKTSNIYALSQESCYVQLNIQSLHFRPQILLYRQDTEQLYLRPNNLLFDLVGAIIGSNPLTLCQDGMEPFLWTSSIYI